MTSSITCLSGGGVPITLPDNLKSVEFYTENPVIGEGTLISFITQNDEWYVGIYEAKSKKFLGYSKVINSTGKPSSKKLNSKMAYLYYIRIRGQKNLKTMRMQKYFWVSKQAAPLKSELFL